MYQYYYKFYSNIVIACCYFQYFYNISCRANTRTVVTRDHRLEIVSECGIAAGEEITNLYMNTDQPTKARLEYLREKWFFNCSCRRCADPTECGSHYSSILCTRQTCCGTVLPYNPLHPASPWHCTYCGDTVDYHTVQAVLEQAAQLVAGAVHDLGVVEHLEHVIHLLSSQLHPNNYILIGVKQKLALLYGNIHQYTMVSMGRPAKQRKLQLCMEVLDCMQKVCLLFCLI